MDVVVVESPAKAKTINKYLGSGYKVLASYGHVRDLPAKDGSVDPDADFGMVWEVGERSEKHLAEIAKALKGADHLYLATDPDREGEAISWHVRDVLEERNVLEGIDVKRVVFHEITKDAVLEALRNPRDLDFGLIDAYLARRALDYLVGFTLSPVLWRKLPGSRSAGRVQSVALRLICERENEIELFKAREFWTVEAEFRTTAGKPLTARLTNLNGRKLGRYDLENEQAANDAAALVSAGAFRVGEIERKNVTRSPPPPFTTSTLQQEASRKLRFGTTHIMRLAQNLYEGFEVGGETVGLITYMRTDSVNVANEAVAASRRLIGNLFGDAYVPDKPNVYKTKAKNAQEAHEAIRPTDFKRTPEQISKYVTGDAFRLYELIWKRAMASAMKRATLEQVGIDIADEAKRAILRATGQVVLFDGFLKLYQEDRDDPAEEDEKNGRILPKVAENESLATGKVTPEQHFTKPPPRYGEASLVKKMEELGIGRPSTYASIMSVLQHRDYVRLEKRRFEPEDRGRIVTAFLTGYFNRYVQYNFTADLENQLDEIANGRIAWKRVLSEFWSAFYQSVQETSSLRISDVIDALDADLGPHFFPPNEAGVDPRVCPSCKTGRLGIKLGRSRPFIGCSNYPECSYTRSLEVIDGTDDGNGGLELPLQLGDDPESGKPVTLRKGPFGFYIQLGETPPKASGEKGKPKKKAKDGDKPKRVTLPKTIEPVAVTLELALQLLALPRDVGLHPETGKKIVAGLGRYGPYLRHDAAYTKLGADDDLLTIGLNRAVTLIAEAPKRGRSNSVLRELGAHPDDGKPVNLCKGRYGPYVKHGRINASISKGASEDEVTLEEAVTLLAARAAKTGAGKPKAKAKSRAKAKSKTKTKTKTRKKPASADV
jgi:DNA topoisomerase-1